MRITRIVGSGRPVATYKLGIPLAVLSCVLLLVWRGAHAAPHPGHAGAGIGGAPCRAWSIMSTPNVANVNNRLSGVATLSASDVWAVGWSTNASYVTQSLLEHWDGHAWNIVSSPSPSPSASGQLVAVAAASPTNLWAVGLYYPTSSSYSQTLILHNDGTGWSVVPSPNVAATNNALQGVAIAGSSVWAVGFTTKDLANNSQTLAEEWNGTTWSIVATPNVDTQNRLSAVTVTSAGSVWAAGWHGNSTDSETLIEQWNGAAWNVVPSPNPSTTNRSGLAAIASLSDSDVWAVGSSVYTTYPGTHDLPLIEHWDGSSWTIASGPAIPRAFADYSSLTSIPGAGSLVAVGEGVYKPNAYAQSNVLIDSWNGTLWTSMPAPDPAASFSNLLYGVSADGQGEMFAVGVTFTSQSASQTLIERYGLAMC